MRIGFLIIFYLVPSIITTGAIAYLFILVVKALKKYIGSKEVRREKLPQ